MEGLIFLRKKDEVSVIDLRKFGLGLIEVLCADFKSGGVRLLFSGRRDIPIHRKEVFDAIEANGGVDVKRPAPDAPIIREEASGGDAAKCAGR